MLRAALRAGLPATYECNSGGCGSCKFIVTEGDVHQINPDASGLSARDRRKGKLLSCQSIPQSNCEVSLTVDPEWPTDRSTPVSRQARVSAVRDLTHDLREITFVADGPASFLPGQFAMIALATEDGGVHAERAYSMSNLSNNKGIWQFQIKRVPGGLVSPQIVDQLAIGDTVRLDGPYGHAHLRANSRDVLCIAGGSGLAPIVSIARGLGARDDAAGRRLAVFYGGRAEEDMCARQFVYEIAGSLGDVQFIEAISSAPSPQWTGAHGFVHDVLATTDISHLDERDIYVAGPPVMTDAVVRHLVLERGVPVDLIHYDRFF